MDEATTYSERLHAKDDIIFARNRELAAKDAEIALREKHKQEMLAGMDRGEVYIISLETEVAKLKAQLAAHQEFIKFVRSEVSKTFKLDYDHSEKDWQRWSDAITAVSGQALEDKGD